jgi:hypothetical protein
MTDERRDDEILGRALARAIETIDVNETPFERSRIATAPTRRRGFPIWQVGAAAAAVVLALALGSWILRPTEGVPGVAASPTATPAPASATPSPTAIATVAPGQLDHYKVYFARDGLPPVGAHVDNAGIGATALERIASRLGGLARASAPSGSTNAFPGSGVDIRSWMSIGISADLVTVDYGVPGGDWKVRGSAQSLALVQQLVYTATEEPGIRRLLVTQNGGSPATLDQFVWDKPLAREDVSSYGTAGSRNAAAGHGTTSGPVLTLTTRTSVEQVTRGLARVVIEAQGASASDQHPDFNVEVVQNDEAARPLGGKWRLVATVARGTDSTTGTRIVDATPLRSLVATARSNNTMVYEIGLDDLRPWRIALLMNPLRIVIDIGGIPSSIVASNAVYVPVPGATVGRTFTVAGVADNFEANVVIRVRDARGTEVYKTSTTATNCCDPGGTFDTSITLPASVSGNVTLEVLEASAKDGSDLKVIAIPLTVRQ